ncbi:hypothetical protein CN97_17325 [Haematobacter massiliensis]|uniref:Uncharacterized protein n=1 Tax=Haematobacter massiliensis TaxID=195105 RepID=A0A086Y5A5_9RHOB|nr:hypothetical protein CN97_17325 [Haematobacter massiliensis]
MKVLIGFTALIRHAANLCSSPSKWPKVKTKCAGRVSVAGTGSVSLAVGAVVPQNYTCGDQGRYMTT